MVAVAEQSGHIYLVTNRHGQHRPDHGFASDHIGRNVRHHYHPAGRARIAVDADCGADRMLPIKTIQNPTLGRISPDDSNFAVYREHLRRTTEEPFALFFKGEMEKDGAS